MPEPGPAERALPAPEVIARYEAGESVEELARAYGVSWQPVRQLLARHGVRVRGRGDAQQARAVARGLRTAAADPDPQRAPVARWDEMSRGQRAALVTRMYEAGESTTQIGQALSVSPETARRVLMDAGVELRQPPGRPRAARGVPSAEVVARYEAGQSGRDLAAAYGVSRSVIYDVLGRAGVPRRGQSAAGRTRARQS